jgi:hypothetical protein
LSGSQDFDVDLKPMRRAMADLVRPDDLKKISSDAEMKKAQEYLARAKKQEEEQKTMRELFMKEDLPPDAAERVNNAVRRAAEQGLHEVQMFSFPASYFNDGGRRINNNEPDWPDSLEGHAKKAYAYFEKELRPLGYKVRVEILDYPGGMPGNVGLFLSW